MSRPRFQFTLGGLFSATFWAAACAAAWAFDFDKVDDHVALAVPLLALRMGPFIAIGALFGRTRLGLAIAGTFGLVAFVLFRLFGMFFFMNSWTFSHVVGEIDFPPARAVVIEGQTYHDEGQGLRYSVIDGGKHVVEKAGLGFSYGGVRSIDLAVLSADNGNIVAIVDTRRNAVIILHDFRSGLSYPAQPTDSRANQLFAKIQKENAGRSWSRLDWNANRESVHYSLGIE